MSTTTEKTTSPIGSTSQQASHRRYRESAAYREQHDRLAPYRAIARAVILARSERGWTQGQLADRLGTTNTVVSRIESGRHGLSLETLHRLARVLDVTFTVGPERLVAEPQDDHHGRGLATA